MEEKFIATWKQRDYDGKIVELSERYETEKSANDDMIQLAESAVELNAFFELISIEELRQHLFFEADGDFMHSSGCWCNKFNSETGRDMRDGMSTSPSLYVWLFSNKKYLTQNKARVLLLTKSDVPLP